VLIAGLYLMDCFLSPGNGVFLVRVSWSDDMGRSWDPPTQQISFSFPSDSGFTPYPSFFRGAVFLQVFFSSPARTQCRNDFFFLLSETHTPPRSCGASSHSIFASLILHDMPSFGYYLAPWCPCKTPLFIPVNLIVRLLPNKERLNVTPPSDPWWPVVRRWRWAAVPL